MWPGRGDTMRRQPLLALGAAWVVALTGCGSHLTRAELQAANGSFKRAVRVEGPTPGAPSAAQSESGSAVGAAAPGAAAAPGPSAANGATAGAPASASGGGAAR